MTYLISDSISLSCSSGSEEFKVASLRELAKPLKAFAYFFIFTFPSFKNFSHFFVSLYKELLEPTFSAHLIILDNLCGVSGCSVMTCFISTMLGFSKVFGWSR